MKTLIVYDSVYGNTEKIAKAIGKAANGEILRTGETGSQEFGKYDLVIVGSPTQAGRPIKAMKEFLDRMPANSLNGISVAAFDTRVEAKEKNILMRAFLNTIGYAAPRIAKELETKGAKTVAVPEGFIVKDSEGPLKDGELERAAEWGKKISRQLPRKP